MTRARIKYTLNIVYDRVIMENIDSEITAV